MKTRMTSMVAAGALIACVAGIAAQKATAQQTGQVTGGAEGEEARPPGDLRGIVSGSWVIYECPADNGRDCTVSVRELENGQASAWRVDRYAFPPGSHRSLSRHRVVDSVGHSNKP